MRTWLRKSPGTGSTNYPSQMYICLYYDTTLVLKRSGVLFAD